jgi:superfamily I DNA/RNA helicase
MPRKKLFESLVVDAKAGTGKTTTLEWADNKIPKGMKPSDQQIAIFDKIGKKPKGAKARFSCFNKTIQLELASRLPNAECVTNNALGHSLVREYLTKYGVKWLKVDKRKYSYLAEEIIGNPYKNKKLFPIITTMADLASMARVTLTGFAEDGRWNVSIEELRSMAETYSVSIESPEAIYRVEELINMGIAAAFKGKLDFNDQIFLPAVFGLKPEKVYRGYIDESQDMNNAQRQLLLGSAEQLIGVGDPNQSMYLFMGAAPDSMSLLQTSLDCDVLPLNETRRCPKSHVSYAQRFLPPGVIFKAHENNIEGFIYEKSVDMEVFKDVLKICEEQNKTNLFISRTNAPLVKYCFSCYRHGIPASIRGRDFAATLMSRLEPFKANSVGETLAKLRGIFETKINSLSAQNKTDLVEAAQDELIVYEIFLEESETVTDAISKMNMIFSDDILKKGIQLTTGHKAKGLEASIVVILTPELFPHPKIASKNPQQAEQEMNCAYVAHTRSKEILILNKKNLA